MSSYERYGVHHVMTRNRHLIAPFFHMLNFIALHYNLCHLNVLKNISLQVYRFANALTVPLKRGHCSCLSVFYDYVNRFQDRMYAMDKHTLIY